MTKTLTKAMTKTSMKIKSSYVVYRLPISVFRLLTIDHRTTNNDHRITNNENRTTSNEQRKSNNDHRTAKIEYNEKKYGMQIGSLETSTSINASGL